MKLSTVLLLAISLQASAFGYSQKVTLSMKKASLQQVFKEINKQTGYEFFFKDELLQKAGKVDVSIKDMPLEQALAVCFGKLSVTYTIIDHTIVIQEKASLDTYEAAPPQVVIKGHVSDTTGKSLVGATVMVQGTKNAVLTDQDGNFSIQAEEGQTLLVSYVGYNTTQYAIGNTAQFVNITLLQRQAELVSVAVVTTGYQQLNKERSAGSFASVTNEAIKNKSISMNVIDRLEGLVPGLSVNYGRNNEKFLVRGLTSVNANKSPLIVVDGVPIYDGTTLTSLVNPEDVESVTVLRDATASSIWGAAAANGVVVVTTKRGPSSATPRKMQVTYSGFTSFRGQPDMDYYNLMSSSQLVKAGREIFDPAAYPWATVTTASSANPLPVVIPQEQVLYDLSRGLITSAVAEARFDSLNRLDNRSQVTDMLYQDALLSSHSLNFRGGSNLYNYYGSFAYTRDESYTKTNLDRYQLNFRQDFALSKSIKLDLTTNLAFENSEKFLLTDFPGTASTVLPYAMLSDGGGNPLSMAYLLRHDPFRASSEAQSRINLDYVPMQEPGYTKNNANTFNARVNAGLSIKLFKGLTYEGRGQYQRQAIDGYEYYDQNSYKVRNERVFFTQQPASAGAAPTYYMPVAGGHYITNNVTQYAWTIRNQLVYDNTFAGKHQITALAGTEIRNDFAKSLGTYKRGYDFQTQAYGLIDEVYLATTGVSNPVNYLPSRTVNITTIKQHTYAETEKRFLSLYSNFAYTYNKRYILNGSIRMDQSNLFGSDPAAQYKPVWSLGGAWLISNEDFFKVNAINNLRLRATYGIAGNAPVPGSGGPYDIVLAGNNAVFSGLGAGYTIFNPKNDLLTWERTATTNFGLDFGLWQNRLTGSFDIYEKLTDNLLGFTPTDPTTGFSYAYDNLGSLSNKGFEIQLTSTNITGKDFTWRTTFTLSKNENMITSLKRSTTLTANNKMAGAQIEGYSAYPLFGYNYIGLDNNGNPMALSVANDTMRLASQVKVDDPYYAGTTQPRWYGGLTNVLTYKGFSLSFLIVYNFGHEMRRDVNRFYTGRINANMPAYFENRWKAPGDENLTDVPKYIANTSTSTSQRNVLFYTQSLRNVVSASYAKIRDLTLSYSFGKGVLNKLSMNELSIYGQVNNIMLWAENKYDIDPEYYDLQQGVRTDRMPAFYTIGLRASFK